MRKSINGLVLMVVEFLKQDPQARALYLFCNKGRDKLKGILWDDNGFLLLYKRMERDRFTFPQDIHTSHVVIDQDLLKWLLKGFDFYKIKENPSLKYTQYF